MTAEMITGAVALLGTGSSVFFYRKYRAAMVAKTNAEAGKVGAETISTLIETINKAAVSFEETRARLETERRLSQAKERECLTKLEALEVLIQGGKREQKAVENSLNSVKQQVQAFVADISAKLEILQATVEKWNDGSQHLN